MRWYAFCHGILGLHLPLIVHPNQIQTHISWQWTKYKIWRFWMRLLSTSLSLPARVRVCASSLSSSPCSTALLHLIQLTLLPRRQEHGQKPKNKLPILSSGRFGLTLCFSSCWKWKVGTRGVSSGFYVCKLQSNGDEWVWFFLFFPRVYDLDKSDFIRSGLLWFYVKRSMKMLM